MEFPELIEIGDMRKDLCIECQAVNGSEVQERYLNTSSHSRANTQVLIAFVCHFV